MSSKSSLIFADLKHSVDFLSDVLSQPFDIYMRAAAILAFNISFELSWKYLQSRLIESGLQGNSPRSVFRESGRVGLLDDVEIWLFFTEQRNLTMHTYQSALAEEVYKNVKEFFLPNVTKLLVSASPSVDI